MKKKIILNIVYLAFPWFIRRRLLNFTFKFSIDEGAYIGFSIICADNLIMKRGSRIGNFNFCKAIDVLEMHEDSGIGTFNYITGFSVRRYPGLYGGERGAASLIMKKSSALTSRHYVDVNGGVELGKFVTVAGIRTVILTHSVNPKLSRQECDSVKIGDYNFIGTNCLFLPGAETGPRNIVHAGAVVSRRTPFVEDHILLGNPAAVAKKISSDEYLYFKRSIQYID